MMKKTTLLATLVSAVLLSGCIAVDRNVALVRLQAQTANMIGLSSSDEIALSSVEFGKSTPLLGQDVRYKATTTKGRVFECTSRISDATLISSASIQPPSCTPIVTHK